jgi:hypothetical protein
LLIAVFAGLMESVVVSGQAGGWTRGDEKMKKSEQESETGN